MFQNLLADEQYSNYEEYCVLHMLAQEEYEEEQRYEEYLKEEMSKSS